MSNLYQSIDIYLKYQKYLPKVLLVVVRKNTKLLFVNS
jgi:hypothetical protein